MKAIEPSSGGTEKYTSDASLVASPYDGQWRRDVDTKVSSEAFDLPERVTWRRPDGNIWAGNDGGLASSPGLINWELGETPSIVFGLVEQLVSSPAFCLRQGENSSWRLRVRVSSRSYSWV